MTRVDRAWIITTNGKTMLAKWIGGRVVLREDARTPEDCLNAAIDKGWEARFIQWFIMGTKTRDQIEALIPAGQDWEPYALVTKYE